MSIETSFSTSFYSLFLFLSCPKEKWRKILVECSIPEPSPCSFEKMQVNKTLNKIITKITTSIKVLTQNHIIKKPHVRTHTIVIGTYTNPSVGEPLLQPKISN